MRNEYYIYTVGCGSGGRIERERERERERVRERYRERDREGDREREGAEIRNSNSSVGKQYIQIWSALKAF